MRSISQKYYSSICRQHRQSIKKQKREELINDNHSEFQLQAIFNDEFGGSITISQEILEKVHLCSNMQKFMNKLNRLDLHKWINIDFVKKIMTNFQIMPNEFFESLTRELQTEQKIRTFIGCIIDKQQWMNSVIIFFIQWLVLDNQKSYEEQNRQTVYLNKICDVIMQLWNVFIDSKQQCIVDFDLLCQLYSQILNLKPQNNKLKQLLLCVPVILKKTISKYSIRLLNNVIQTNEQPAIYNILFDPHFDQFIKQALIKLPTKETLVLLFEITCYQNWNNILKSNTKSIANNILHIFYQKDQLQILTLVVLGNFTKKYFSELADFFDQIDYQQFIINIRSKNMNDGLGVLLLILQYYGSELVWQKLFYQTDFVRLVVDQCQNLSQLDLYDHLVFIVEENIENINQMSQQLITIVQGTKKLELSQQTFELVMEIQNYFMMNDELI